MSEDAKLRLKPRPALMKVLHMASGTSETFTIKEIYDLVIDYIQKRRLYDKQDMRVVHCGKDLLGAALGVDTFTAYECLNLYRKNCIEPDSGICLRDIRPNSRQPQATTASEAASHTTAAQPTRMETTTATPASMSSYHRPKAQLRLKPRPALMKVLHLAGGTSETFTIKEIYDLVIDYIQKRRLYDKQDMRVVHCGKDLLGAALGVDTFTAYECLNLYRKNCIEPDSGICLRDIRPNSRQPQATTASGAASHTTAAQPTRMETTTATPASMSSYHRPKAQLRLKPRPALMKVLHLAGGTSETFTIKEIYDLVIDYIQKRRLYDKQDMRVVHCGKDLLGAALGVDTFTAYECLNLYRKNCIEPDSGICLRDIRPNSRQPQATTASGAASYTTAAQPTRKETTTGTPASMSGYHRPAAQDMWQCVQCQKKNPPCHRNCEGCLSLRSDCLPPSIKDVQDAACGHQPSTSMQILHYDKSVNMQTQSQQMSKNAIPSSQEQECDRLDLNNASATRNGKICRKRKCSSSLYSSDSQEGKVIEGMERIQQASAGKYASVLLAKDELCVVCLTHRKTASIVHGETGHQSCCYHCATQLKLKGMPCPICRRPIEKIIHNFYV